MTDLIATDDWEDFEVDLAKAATGQAETWSVVPAAGTVEHLGTASPGFGIVTFPTRLINGEFSATVTVTKREWIANQAPETPHSCAGALVFRHLDPDRYYAFGIGGWGFNHSLFYTKPAMGAYRPWRVEGEQGDEWKRTEQVVFDLAVRLSGSSLECFVNGSRRFSETLPPDAQYLNGQVGFYAYLDSPVRFSNIRLRRAPLKCFIVCPIDERFDNRVYAWVKEAIEKLEIDGHPVKCFRADESTRSEPFIRTIIQEMKSANVSVVLVPGDENTPENRNENMFYELGMAHALSLPTILCAENYTRVPADLRHLNIVRYPGPILISSVRELLSKDTYQPIHVG